jgi:hypothetical protein
MANDPRELGDAPIEDAYRQKMNELAAFLDRYFNGEATRGQRKTGFVLMVFDFGEGGGRANYISNANRSDVVTLLKEQLRRFEGAPDMTGHA